MVAAVPSLWIKEPPAFHVSLRSASCLAWVPQLLRVTVQAGVSVGFGWGFPAPV